MKIDLVNTFWPHWPGMNTEVLYVQVCLALAELAVLGHVFTFEPLWPGTKTGFRLRR